MAEHPIVAMEKGHINDVPYMLGYTEKEGIWRINYITPDGAKGLQLWGDFVHNLDELLLLAVGIFDSNSKDKHNMIQDIKKYYNLEKIGNCNKIYCMVTILTTH